MENRHDTKDENKEKDPFQTDPPVVVGGGGSFFVWIRKNTIPKLVDPKTGKLPPGIDYDKYYCWQCDAVIKHIEVEDGNGNSVKPPAEVHKDKHVSVFKDV